MRPRTQIKIVRNNLPLIVPAIERRAVPLVNATLEAVKTNAQEFAPVDTSSLQKGIYIRTVDHSEYNDAVEAARAVNPPVEIVPEIDAPERPTQGVVSEVVGHGLAMELGGSRKAPKGYLTPAAEMNRDPFFKGAAEAVSAGIQDACK